MKLVSKIAFSALVAGGLALSAQANTITGGLSFAGADTFYSGIDGGGSVVTDLTLASSLAFNGGTAVVYGSYGSFSGMDGSTATTAPYLNILSPLPSGAIWSDDGFSLTLTSLSYEQPTTSSFISLTGAGTISDGNSADDVTGIWNFSSQTAGNGGVFSWSASSGTVPDVAPSALLLALGVVALGAYSQFRKQAA